MRTMLQRVVVGAVILTLAGGVAACGGDNTTAGTAGNQPTGEAIVIGNVGNTSVRGPKIRDFAVMQPAVQAWAGEVNKTGGIGGRPVLVVVGDDANDPAAQLRLVQEMVEQRGVVAFAGMPAADTQDASVEYLEAKGVPVAGGVLANPAWGTSPILFPQGMGGQQKLRLLTRAAATSGKTRWAFIGLLESDVDATARASRSRAAEEAGIQVVFDGQIYPGAPDAAELCRSAKRAGAELMSIAAGPGIQATVVESCARERFHPIYVIPPPATDQEVLDLVGDEMEGAIGTSWTVPWMADEPADLPVWRAAMNANGLPSDRRSLLGWVSGRLLEEALRSIDGEITPQTTADALRRLDGTDLGGLLAPLDFGSTPTEPNPGSNCFWTVIAKDGAWTPAKDGRICLPNP